MNVFYCDDDSDDITFFKKAISKINTDINVTTFIDAEEALKYLAEVKKKPNLLFIDLNMPKMDGLECVIAIKRNKELKRIPITILSNGIGKQQIMDFNRLGVFQFISKASYEDLENSLKNLLTVAA